MPLQNPALFLLGQSMENLPEMASDLPKQGLPPLLGNKHNRVFATPPRMR